MNLDGNDPVYQLFQNQLRLSEAGEGNWWSGVKDLLAKYSITLTFEEIKAMSKQKFRWTVKEIIGQFAFEQLKQDCASRKKTAKIKYESFGLQPYLTQLYPNRSKTVFKLRCETLDIKSHQPYKYSDLVCRKCGIEDETVEHILHCCSDEVKMVDVKEMGQLEACTKAEVLAMVCRINEFINEHT